MIHINERAKANGTEPAKVIASQKQAAIDEVNGKPKPEPFKAVLVDKRKQVLAEYGAVANQLATGRPDDKRLAIDITKFAQSMQPVQTQHEKRVAELQSEQGQEPAR